MSKTRIGFLTMAAAITVAVIATTTLFYSCRKQSLPDATTTLDVDKNSLHGLTDLMKIPDVSADLKKSLDLSVYRFRESNDSKFWTIGLKRGSFGFEESKVLVSLSNSRFSMIFLSYDYDPQVYNSKDIKTYSGVTSTYDQHLRKINSLVYEKGKIVRIISGDASTGISTHSQCWDCPPPNHNWCIEFPPLCESPNPGGNDGPNPYDREVLPEGGSGGSGGGQVEEYNNIVNDPCLKRQVDNAVNRGCQIKIIDFINNVFQGSLEFDLTILDGPISSGTSMGADAYTTTSFKGGRWVTEIKLNTLVMLQSSDEYTAATILHEALHAWINYKFPLATDPNSNLNQHSMMADPFRFNLMRDGLMQMFPNLSLQDATDLTWGGLYQTIQFSSLPPADKDRIRQKNLDYRASVLGTTCP